MKMKLWAALAELLLLMLLIGCANNNKASLSPLPNRPPCALPTTALCQEDINSIFSRVMKNKIGTFTPIGPHVNASLAHDLDIYMPVVTVTGTLIGSAYGSIVDFGY